MWGCGKHVLVCKRVKGHDGVCKILDKGHNLYKELLVLQDSRSRSGPNLLHYSCLHTAKISDAVIAVLYDDGRKPVKQNCSEEKTRASLQNC